MGFQRSTRPSKPADESPKEISTVERGADLPQSIKESSREGRAERQASPKKKVKLDPNAPLTKNFTVPANDHLLELIQKAAKAESERTGYKVSGRMLCHKLLKEHLGSIGDQ